MLRICISLFHFYLCAKCIFLSPREKREKKDASHLYFSFPLLPLCEVYFFIVRRKREKEDTSHLYPKDFFSFNSVAGIYFA